jgi:hypothetical protein
MASQQVDKSIVEITEYATIVYANADIDTLITINGNGLQWWFKGENNNYDLVDSFQVRIDLNKATIADARQLAEDWFLTSLGEETDTPSEPMTTVPSVHNNTELKKVVPGYRQTKDAHTEHCCLEHRHCYFNNSNCSVVLGKKKPSYPCRCNHD